MQTAERTFVVDTIAPDAPVITSPTTGATLGGAPTVTGTAEAGSEVALFVDGAPIGAVTATGGTFSVALSSLALGSHAVTADATDAAGNRSELSGTVTFTLEAEAEDAGVEMDAGVETDAGGDADVAEGGDASTDPSSGGGGCTAAGGAGNASSAVVMLGIVAVLGRRRRR